MESLQNERLPHGWVSRQRELHFQLRINDERGRLEIDGSVAPHAAGCRIEFISKRVRRLYENIFSIVWLLGLLYIIFPALSAKVPPILIVLAFCFFLAFPFAVNAMNQRSLLLEFKNICFGGMDLKGTRNGLTHPVAAGQAGKGTTLTSPFGLEQITEKLRASASESLPITFDGPLFFMRLPATEVVGKVDAGRMGSRVSLFFNLRRRNQLLLALYSIFVVIVLASLFLAPDVIEGGPCAFNLTASAVMLLGPWGIITLERWRTLRKIRKIIG